MRYTAVHRELGIPAQDLTWEHIEAVLAQRVRERADLDWKREAYGSKNRANAGPGDADRAQGEESAGKGEASRADQGDLVKDAAAMANSGGGWIVLGIDEDKATTKASGVFRNGVALSDADQRSYRQRVASATRPAITGIDFTVIEDGASRAVTIVAIPDSLDAPHLMVDQNRFKAPFRDGPQTAWMTERHLESAYRRRFDTRGAARERREFLYQEAADNSHVNKRVCFVAAAVPEIGRPEGLGRPSKEDVVAVFAEAAALAKGLLMAGANWGMSPYDDCNVSDDVFLNPRHGHRRRVARSDNEDGDPRHRSLMVAIHNDGAVSLAWSIGGMLSGSLGDLNETASRCVEAGVADFVATVAAASRLLGTRRGYTLECGLVYRGTDPIVIRQPDRGFSDKDMDATYSIPVTRFLPAVDTLFEDHDQSDLARVAGLLALDCVSQGGVWGLKLLPTPS
jgi:hypothetical protein